MSLHKKEAYQSVNVWVEIKGKITLSMLKQVFKYDKASNNAKTKMDTMLPQMVDELNRIQDNKPMYMHYNLDTKARLEHFFAQCCVEVGDDFKTEEGLNYTSAQRLKEVFSSKFKDNEKKADELVALKTDRSKAIANYVYSDRNGNKGGDDGYNFRGRGLLHLTGRGSIQNGQNEGYAGFNQKVTHFSYGGLQGRDFVNNSKDRDSIGTNGLEVLLAGVYAWKTLISKETKKHLYEIADQEDSICSTPKGVPHIPNLSNNLRLISQRINGGNNGLPDRQNALERIRRKGIFNDFK